MNSERCRHTFTRRPMWWLHSRSWMRWECRCGETTRTYDSIDAWAGRPIHAFMSVAFPGFNTARTWRQS